MTYTKDEMKKSINNIIVFINKNNRFPNTVKVGKTTYKIKDYLKLNELVLAKKAIVEFKNKNKRYPNYVTILKVKMSKDIYSILFSLTSTSNSINNVESKSKTRFVSTPHLTTTSEGLGQDTGYYCACNSLQQSIYKLTGKKLAESKIASICGTTTNGTGHEGINTFIAWFNKKYKTNLKITWKYFSDFGKTDKECFKSIGELLAKKNTAVFFHLGYHNGGSSCSTKGPFGHYEMCDIIDIGTGYVRVLNSLGSKRNSSAYYGFLQDRSFSVQKCFINGCSQKSVCVITKE